MARTLAHASEAASPGKAYGKWGGGAQLKPPGEKAKRITITLEPALLAWVDSLGDKRSQTIARLLTEARERLSVA
jgi:hypothetical protein